MLFMLNERYLGFKHLQQVYTFGTCSLALFDPLVATPIGTFCLSGPRAFYSSCVTRAPIRAPTTAHSRGRAARVAVLLGVYDLAGVLDWERGCEPFAGLYVAQAYATGLAQAQVLAIVLQFGLAAQLWLDRLD